MPSIKKHSHRPWLPEKKPFSGYQHHNTDFYQSRKWRSLRALKLQQEYAKGHIAFCIRGGLPVHWVLIDAEDDLYFYHRRHGHNQAKG